MGMLLKFRCDGDCLCGHLELVFIRNFNITVIRVGDSQTLELITVCGMDYGGGAYSGDYGLHTD